MFGYGTVDEGIKNSCNKYYIKCKNYLRLNQSKVLVATITFLAGTMIQVLLSSYSTTLVSLDKGISQWAKSNVDSQNEKYVYDSGIIKFINSYVWVFFLGPILVVIVSFCLWYHKERRGLPQRICTYEYLYFILAPAAYLILGYTLVLALRFSFNRPRPYMTTEFYPSFDIDVECKLEFQPAYRRYTGPNPCNYILESCPSGHCATITMALLIMLKFSLYFKKLMCNRDKQVVDSLSCWTCYIMITTTCLCMVSLIPITMVARISFLKHFFTDTCGGVALGITFYGVFELMEPFIHNKRDQEQMDVQLIQANE